MNDQHSTTTDRPTGSASSSRGTTLTPDEYRHAFRRRQRLRWFVLTDYIVVVLAMVAFSVSGLVDEATLFPILSLVVYGGLIVLLLVLLYPYVKPIQTASLPDGELVPPPDDPEGPESIRETNHIWIIYKFSAVVWLVVTTPIVYMGFTSEQVDLAPLQVIGAIAAVQFLVMWLLGRITAEADQTGIEVGMGPFKSKTPIEDIQSIRSCTIRPLRDFLGWGWRVKVDGTRGFIGDGNVGVEITRRNGARTVVTVREPQRFVDFVRRVKATHRLDTEPASV